MKTRLLLGIVVPSAVFLGGCKFPAFEGSDICSGLVAGDRLRLELVSIEQDSPDYPCSPEIGLEVESIISSKIYSNGEAGCGKAVGPVDFDSAQALGLEFDLQESLYVGDSRANAWVSFNRSKEGDCEGEFTFKLFGADSSPIEKDASTGNLNVSYIPRRGPDNCRQACRHKFAVTASKE